MASSEASAAPPTSSGDAPAQAANTDKPTAAAATAQLPSSSASAPSSSPKDLAVADDSAERARAATKLQAMQRGRASRRTGPKKKAKKNTTDAGAAHTTRDLSLAGEKEKAARDKLAADERAAVASKAAAKAADHDDAGHDGHFTDGGGVTMQVSERNDIAATHLQSITRGRQARTKNRHHVMRERREAAAAAQAAETAAGEAKKAAEAAAAYKLQLGNSATKIQSIFRGRKARKDAKARKRRRRYDDEAGGPDSAAHADEKADATALRAGFKGKSGDMAARAAALSAHGGAVLKVNGHALSLPEATAAKKLMEPAGRAAFVTEYNAYVARERAGELEDVDAHSQYHQNMFRRLFAAVGPHHPLTLVAANNVGVLRCWCVDWEAGRAFYKRAFRGMRKNPRLGPNHPSTLRCEANLGLLLRQQKSWKAAQQLYGHCLKKNAEFHGPDHDETNRMRMMLAGVERKLNRIDASCNLFTRALGGLRKTRGSEDPQVLRTAIGLGLTLSYNGDVMKMATCDRSANANKAIQTAHRLLLKMRDHREMLEDYECELDPDMPHVFDHHNETGLGLEVAHLSTESAEFVRLMNESADLANPEFVAAYGDEAHPPNAHQKKAGGITLWDKAQRSFRMFGHDHAHPFLFAYYGGLKLWSRGDFDEAAELLAVAHKAAIAVAGGKKTHEMPLIVAHAHGRCLRDLGDFDGATRLYRSVLQGHAKRVAPDCDQALAAMCDLGNMYRLKGNTGKAFEGDRMLLAKSSQLYRAALDGYKHRYGTANVHTLHAAVGLAIVLADYGELDVSQRIHRKALEKVEESLYGDRPTLLDVEDGPSRPATPSVAEEEMAVPEYAGFDPSMAERLEKGVGCDVQVSVGGKFVGASRLVLIARSPLFKAAFGHPGKLAGGMVSVSKDLKSAEIVSKTLDPNAVETLLRGAVRGRLRVSLKRVPGVLAAARALEMAPAVAALEDWVGFRAAPDDGNVASQEQHSVEAVPELMAGYGSQLMAGYGSMVPAPVAARVPPASDPGAAFTPAPPTGGKAAPGSTRARLGRAALGMKLAKPGPVVAPHCRYIRMRSTWVQKGVLLAVSKLSLVDGSKKDRMHRKVAFAKDFKPGFRPTDAVDGRDCTMWVQRNLEIASWIAVDLGTAVKIEGCELTLCFEEVDNGGMGKHSHFTYKYVIEGSNDLDAGWFLILDRRDHRKRQQVHNVVLHCPTAEAEAQKEMARTGTKKHWSQQDGVVKKASKTSQLTGEETFAKSGDIQKKGNGMARLANRPVGAGHALH